MASRLANLRNYGIWATQGLCVTLLVQKYVGDITMCSGPSMLPTFNSVGDVVLLEFLTWRWKRDVAVGDVVVAYSPLHFNRIVCKRVLGLPGDTVLKDPTVGAETVKVPPGHVWLQGDNMSHSIDSRTYGPLPMGLLKGKVLFKLWPHFEIVK
ncbi:hypothetical protein HDU99_006310 [Rhizoclosmatium hyalinum]|nr:hypothetical protein HDU99_006310 [Rhizoclosmatium hyalinum]